MSVRRLWMASCSRWFSCSILILRALSSSAVEECTRATATETTGQQRRKTWNIRLSAHVWVICYQSKRRQWCAVGTVDWKTSPVSACYSRRRCRSPIWKPKLRSRWWIPWAFPCLGPSSVGDQQTQRQSWLVNHISPSVNWCNVIGDTHTAATAYFSQSKRSPRFLGVSVPPFSGISPNLNCCGPPLIKFDANPRHQFVKSRRTRWSFIVQTRDLPTSS